MRGNWLVIAGAASMSVLSAQAGRPLVVDDAYAVSPRTFEFDALAGPGLAGEAPDWRIAAGRIWTFDSKRDSQP